MIPCIKNAGNAFPTNWLVPAAHYILIIMTGRKDLFLWQMAIASLLGIFLASAVLGYTVTTFPEDSPPAGVYKQEQAKTGHLIAESTPSAVRVILNGRAIGITPIESELQPGEYRLQMELGDYLPRDTTITIKGGQTLKFRTVLKPAAYLTVIAYPDSARPTIFVNGSQVATGRLEKFAVPCTSRSRVRVHAPGFDVHEETIEPSKGERKFLTVRLKSRHGSLHVRSEPTGATVYLDDLKAGTTPFRKGRLAAGKHDVRFELYRHEPVQKQVSITRDSLTELSVSLRPSAAFRAKNKKVRRMVFAVAGATLGGLGGYFHFKHESAYRTYSEEKSLTGSKHEQNWKKVESSRHTRNLLLGLSAANGLGLGFSIFF